MMPIANERTIQAPYKQTLLNPSPNSPIVSTPVENSLDNNAPIDYDMQRTEIELTTALGNAPYLETELGDNVQPTSSDQSFISRLLN